MFIVSNRVEDPTGCRCFWMDPDAVFEVMSDPCPVFKIWSDPDPVSKIWSDPDPI